MQFRENLISNIEGILGILVVLTQKVLKRVKNIPQYFAIVVPHDL